MTMPARVTYSLAPVNPQPGGIKQNTRFDVALYAKDERAPASYTYRGVKVACPRGVFAAYLNVHADPSALRINGVTFNWRFQNGRVYNDNNGTVFLGAFCGIGAGNPAKVEVCRLHLEALTLYTPEDQLALVYMNVFNLKKPEYDTLVYGVDVNLIKELNLTGEQSLVDPADVACQPLAVTVLGNPEQ